MFAFCSSYFYFYFQQLKTYLFLPHLHSVESIKQLNGPNVLGTKEPSCDADILLGLQLCFAVLMTRVHPK